MLTKIKKDDCGDVKDFEALPFCSDACLCKLRGNQIYGAFVLNHDRIVSMAWKFTKVHAILQPNSLVDSTQACIVGRSGNQVEVPPTAGPTTRTATDKGLNNCDGVNQDGDPVTGADIYIVVPGID